MNFFGRSTPHKIIGVSTIFAVSLFRPVEPAHAQSIPTFAAISATEQFVKIYDPKTRAIKVELKAANCESSKYISNPVGYSRICKGNDKIVLLPVAADAIEQRDGIAVLSFITANGLARARQASTYEQWGTNFDIAALADVQSECIAGVYLKSALPVTVPSQDLIAIQNYIKKTGSQSSVLIAIPGKTPVTAKVNGPIRAMAFRHGFDSGNLDSCFVTTDPGQPIDDTVARLKRLLYSWTEQPGS